MASKNYSCLSDSLFTDYTNLNYLFKIFTNKRIIFFALSRQSLFYQTKYTHI
jgi:hypothetical protein